MSLNLNICRNLLFLCICPPKLSPSNCFFVSWCPLMLGWENTPRAWKHPHQFGEGRGIEREKPILRFWRVNSTGHDRKVPWGSTPEGAWLPPFIPAKKLQFHCSDHHLCPKSSREAVLAGCYVNCTPFACRKPSTGWYGNPPQSTQGCSMKNRLFGEGTGVSVKVATLVPKSVRGRKDPCNHTFIWKIVL